MNTDEPFSFDPEDPRLTAYALGELTDPAERAAVEQTLGRSPEARDALREIRELTATLTAEYEQERRVSVASAHHDPLPGNVITMEPALRSRSLWPRRLLLAAAALLLLAAVASLLVSRHAEKITTPASTSSTSELFALDSKDPSTLAARGKLVPAAPTSALPNVPPAASTPQEMAKLDDMAKRSDLLAATDTPNVARVAEPEKQAPAPPSAVVAPDESGGAVSPDSTRDKSFGLAAASAPAAPMLDGTQKKTVLALAAATPPAPAPALSEKRVVVTGSSIPSAESPSVTASTFSGSYSLNGTLSQNESKALVVPPSSLTTGAGSIQYGNPIGGMATERGMMAAPGAPAGPSGKSSGLSANSINTLLASTNLPSAKKADVYDQRLAGGISPTNGPVAAAGSVALSKSVAGISANAVDALLLSSDDSSDSRRDKASGKNDFPFLAPAFNTATYEHLVENPFLSAKDNPLSTFSIDVDTASYANVRRFIESGTLPPVDAVRVEELVNYFPYAYAPPAPGDDHPFAVHLEAASCPWNPSDRLVRIGIKGREIARDKRPPSNLVFLLDVSGSMEPPERLPLIKASMRLLVEQLTEDDRVAIVTYAGESGVALPSTTGDHKERILRALEDLHAHGSTNGASGIKLAYEVARSGFIKNGTNRVILATDGDFNVGVTSQGELVRMIEKEAKSGVFLSALGVGTDNYKDSTMQKLADKGNGNYAYIDRLDEARKVLVEQMSGTLVTIAKDVKIQVEFNPATVAAYRLIGYEKRALRKEDFNDDRIDAGEIGAGHTITALYEVVPLGRPVPTIPPAVDALKYGNPAAPVAIVDSPALPRPESATAPSVPELLTVKMRHKAPDGDKSERSYEEALVDHAAPGDFANSSPDFKFAAAVASFALVLRDSPYKGEATLGSALELAQEGKGTDPGAYRAGFLELVQHARAIQTNREK